MQHDENAANDQPPVKSGDALIDLRTGEVVPLAAGTAQNAAAARKRPRPRRRVPLILFLLTCASTFFTGAFVMGFGPAGGALYSLSVLSILLAHEMGHFLQAVRYAVPASLPYFLPMPLSPLGTLGAVIFQGRGAADRKQMFDIAISGPLAGLALALPISYLGLRFADIQEFSPTEGALEFSDPLLMQWMIEWIHRPLAENEAVMLNPLLLAGWTGIFITALNLIPIGQLDGGHMMYCMVREKAHWVARMLMALVIAYVIISGNFGWVLAIVLLLLMGPRHPPTADDTVALRGWRYVLGWVTLAFVFIGFTPKPIIVREPTQTRESRPPADPAGRGDSSKPITASNPIGNCRGNPPSLFPVVRG